MLVPEVETFYCGCVHDFQDEAHGKNQRVHNKMGGKDGNMAKCTACGTAKTKAVLSKTAPPKKK